MVNNSKYNKFVFFGFGLIFAFFVLFSLYFMTRYAYIIVFYTINSTTKAKEYNPGSGTGSSTNNFLLTTFWSRVFQKNGDIYAAKEGWNISLTFANRDEFVKFIVDYRDELNSFNNALLWFGIVGLIAFAAVLIAGNHNRNVYYISNLIVGIVFALTMIIFGLILLIKDLSLLSKFNENEAFWKAVSVAQNKGNDTKFTLEYTKYVFSNDADSYLKGDSTNAATLIATMIFLIISIGYSVFTMVHTIRKYIATKAHRKEVLERAGVIA